MFILIDLNLNYIYKNYRNLNYSKILYSIFNIKHSTLFKGGTSNYSRGVSHILSNSFPMRLPTMEDPLAKNTKKDVASMAPLDDASFSGCGTNFSCCNKSRISILLK